MIETVYLKVKPSTNSNYGRLICFFNIFIVNIIHIIYTCDRRDNMKKFFSILFATVLMVSITLPTASAATNQLEVHFIDVGQGDATLVKAPNGKTMLVDGGARSAGKDVVAYLKSKGVKKLDYVVATHPDADHIGGLINVLESFTVNNFIDSGKVHTTDTYYEMLTLVDTKNIKYHVPTIGKKYQLDPKMVLEVLYADENADDNNDASIVLKMTYNKVSFLLMGDASTEIEDALMATNNMKATVLKAGHHGSDTSSSAKFVSVVKPATAILSYGKNNSYGHPHAAVVSRLSKVGAKTYETPKHCNIIVKSDGVKHTVSTECAKKATTTAPKQNTTKPATVKPTVTKPTTRTNFKNCTDLRTVYPDGVPEGHAAYQGKMDRDKDGWACE